MMKNIPGPTQLHLPIVYCPLLIAYCLLPLPLAPCLLPITSATNSSGFFHVSILKAVIMTKISLALCVLWVVKNSFAQQGIETIYDSDIVKAKITNTQQMQFHGSVDELNIPGNHNNSSQFYALVAGGSKGIGYALAEALAKRGYNLILIARCLDSLKAAKNKLETAYKVQVDILVNDLSRQEAADEISQWCLEKNIPLKILCNVAGFGGARDYLSTLPLDTLR